MPGRFFVMGLPLNKERDFSKPLDRVSLYVDRTFAGMRLDRFLRHHIPWRSRTGIQKLIEEGKILRRPPGQEAENPAGRAAGRVLAGETILFLVPEKREAGVAPPRPVDLEIVYEDEFFLAVNKPPYLPVHPSARYQKETLISILHKRYRHEDPHRDIVPKLCHRLDRETSGLILVSKNDLARTRLGKIFEGRRVLKEYLALVKGEMKDSRGRIDLPLGFAQDSQVRIRMAVRHDGKGLASCTDYEVRERYRGYTLVAARLLTGRQHQIRVHFSAIGHPVVGDKIYGPDEGLFLKSLETHLDAGDREILEMERHALHAHRLGFNHPMSKDEMEIRAELPTDMARFCSALERLDR